MDYMKHARRETIAGEELVFVRCDKEGNEIPAERLRELNYTNSTIEKIVTEVAGRISGGADFSEGITTY